MHKKQIISTLKNAWNAGADYLRRGWEIEWNRLIGARVLEEYEYTYPVFTCTGSSTSSHSDIQLRKAATSAIRCTYVYETGTRIRWVNKPSDGLIKKSSQVAEISRWNKNRSGDNERKVELRGVNHFEMGVHTRVDRLFENAFRGAHGPYFKTAERN